LATDVRLEKNYTPYRAMATVYDRWMRHDHAPYDQWCEFIDREFRRHTPTVADVLEIGCGTGAMTSILRGLGYRMTGVDASPDMLDLARDKLGESVPLILARMPAPAHPDFGDHDAAICCFDTANYLIEDGQLAASFRQIAGALRPGGLFIFDTNTQFKFEHWFANHRFGDDLDEFAYVWRSRHDADTHRCEFLLSFFVAEGELYRRSVERHIQRSFSEDEVTIALAESGFVVVGTCEEYSDKECSPTTPRITWVAHLE
jgi:SAM-dependent methyltransferase